MHVYLNVWTGNVSWFPHHWIVGLILVFIGIIGRKKGWGWVKLVGVGMFASDFDDFWGLKIFEPDVLGVKDFWQVD